MLGARNKLYVIILLFSFLGVQFISLGCTLINVAHQLSHKSTDKSGHKHSHSHHHSEESNPSDSKPNAESCCVENSSIFLSGIQANLTSETSILPPVHIISTTYLINGFNKILCLKSISLQIRPPPKITFYSSLKRVILQSFQV